MCCIGKDPAKRVPNYLNALKEATKEMPCIYVRLFVNKRHHAPTPQQMYDFSQWAIVYSKPCHEWTAQQLDDVYLAEKQSNRKLAKEDVQHANRQIIPGDHRNKLNKVKIWATAIKQRMLALPSVDWDKSLPSPPTDTSYAKSAEMRRKVYQTVEGTSIFTTLLTHWYGAHYPGDD